MDTFKTNPAETDHFSEQRSYVTFRLVQQTFALPIEPIAQIVEMVRVTALPHAPTSVKGIINWHGILVPVLDLGLHLGAADHTPNWRSHVILVQFEGHYVGLIVDEVLDVIKLARHQISQPSEIFPVGLSDSIHLIDGLARIPGQLLLLLDLNQLFVRSTLDLAELTANLPAELPAESEDMPAQSVQAALAPVI